MDNMEKYRGGYELNKMSVPIAANVASKLFAAEEAIDFALNKSAELAGLMPMARQQINLSAEVGQDAIEYLLDSMKRLGEARKHMIDAHKALARTQEAARIAPRNFGGFVDKPRGQAVRHSQVSLSLVKKASMSA